MSGVKRSHANSGNPRFEVPNNVYLGVEHPFKVQNVSRAIESLGGQRRIAKLVAARGSDTHETQLSLHPGKYQLNSVLSSNTEAKSLVCQAIVPKLIGKKRKRESGNTDIEIHAHGLNGQQRLVQAIKDRPSECIVRVIGQQNRVHKFRTMPDFGFSSHGNQFIKGFNSTIGTLKYDAVKEFQLRENEDIKPDTELIPPPLFTPHTIPFNYVYQQNTSVKVVVGADGEVTTLNESSAQKMVVSRVPMDIVDVPSEPPTGVTPISSLPPVSKVLIEKLRELFKDRPIWSRRAITYQLRHEQGLGNLKWLFQYVGYEFVAGPWAMTIIRFGIDPRVDPECRIYQSITLHIEPPARYHPIKPAKSHRGGARPSAKHVSRVDKDGVPGYIFTGKSLVLDGKTWQVCDIQDPLISSIFSTQDIRSQCEMDSDGWFKNGTWGKAKVIFRYKVRSILNEDPSWVEEDFVQAAQMPDEFDAVQRDLPVDTEGWSRRAILIAFHIKHGSLSFGKTRNQWASQDVSEAVMQALRKYDDQDTSGRIGSGESLAELLEGEQDLLNDGTDSEEMNESDEDDIDEAEPEEDE